MFYFRLLLSLNYVCTRCNLQTFVSFDALLEFQIQHFAAVVRSADVARQALSAGMVAASCDPPLPNGKSGRCVRGEANLDMTGVLRCVAQASY